MNIRSDSPARKAVTHPVTRTYSESIFLPAAAALCLALVACGGGGGGASVPAPSINSQPQSMTAVAGYSTTFSVSAAGAASLSYQWQHNGTVISGATSPTYTINSTAPSDAGSYDVVVSDSAGQTTSQVATLTVNPVAAACTATVTSNYDGGAETLTHIPAVVKIASAPAGAIYFNIDYMAPSDNTGSPDVKWNYEMYTLDSQGNCTLANDLFLQNGENLAFSNGGGGNGLFLSIIDPTPNTTNQPLVGVCAYGSTPPQPCDPNSLIIGGRTFDASNKSISGVTISFVENGITYSTTSDSLGTWALAAPIANLPTSIALTLYDNPSYVPQVLTMNTPGATSAAAGVSRYNTVALAANGPQYAIVEVAPTVHHLGDSNYTGSANSQFQYPSAQGTSFTATFAVQSASLAYAHATIDFSAKGIECPDTLSINGGAPYVLGPSASDGSYSTYSIPVSPNVFSSGGNAIRINSVNYGGPGNGVCANGDYDDFEFANVIIKFSN